MQLTGHLWYCCTVITHCYGLLWLARLGMVEFVQNLCRIRNNNATPKYWVATLPQKLKWSHAPSTQAQKQWGKDANAKWALPANVSSSCLVHKQLWPLKVGLVIEKRFGGASAKISRRSSRHPFYTPNIFRGLVRVGGLLL